MATHPKRRRGRCLASGLAICAILGVLAALIPPAIQSAREAARQVQCRNNLKQLAFACLCHNDQHERLPTGGWGGAWTGDADLGFGRSQPGGWLYGINPYIECCGLYEMGGGENVERKNAAHLQRLKAPFAVYYCPSRRLAQTYPWVNTWGPVNSGMPTEVARSDYAANGGDVYTSPGRPVAPLWQSAPPGDQYGPASLAEGGVKGTESQTANAERTFDNIDAAATGVIFCGSMIKIADLIDGTTNIYLIGEKYLNPDAYTTGTDPGDNLASLVGDNDDVARWALLPPTRDMPGYQNRFSFGSAHPHGFHAAFCDGSARMQSYEIAPDVHRELSNRKDNPMVEEEKPDQNADMPSDAE